MKLKSAVVLTNLLVLLSIAASGCSSLGVALDTNFVGESYVVSTPEKENVLESQSLTNTQVFPKLVNKRNRRFEPLIIFEKGSYLTLGADYEIVYLGYDTPQLFSDVINNRKSLSTALEEPEIGSDNDLRVFLFLPHISIATSFKGGSVEFAGFSFPFLPRDVTSYTSIFYNKNKYQILDDNLIHENFFTSSFSQQLSSGDLLTLRVSAISFDAVTENNADKINFSYRSMSLKYRYYF